jgi:hypothetical protein
MQDLTNRLLVDVQFIRHYSESSWRPRVTISRTFATVSAFLDIEGRKILESSWRFPRTFLFV